MRKTFTNATKTLTFISVLFFFSWAHAETLTISILAATGEQRTIFTLAAQEFEANNPGVIVKVIAKNDADYKAELNQWLDDENGPDAIHWQGGERLFQYVKRDKILSLESFWNKNKLHSTFSQGSISAVSYNDTPYAVPISYYQWGFFYRKSLFKKLRLSPPETWDDFLEVCRVLKRDGVTPITIGTKNNWPTAAWFDYLNLRINGLDFHRQLLTGEIPFTDDRVARVFKEWKGLIDKQYFVAKQKKWDWKEAMPFLYHKKAGMTLVGNFFAGILPATIRDDFAFFPFPKIDENLPMYEEAPLDLFMIPKKSKNKALAKKFLLQVSGKQFQENYNETQKLISPNLKSRENSDYFIKAGTETLNSAAGLSQFFDRDTNSKMADASIKIFAEFMEDTNVNRTLSQLESARGRFLSQ